MSEQVETKKYDHVLHVSYDGEDLQCSVTCPHDRDDFERGCVMWFECGCRPEDPYEVDGEVCPNSKKGRLHQMILGGPGVLCVPSRQCFVVDNEYLNDAVSDLHPAGSQLTSGDYRVSWNSEEFEYLTLTLDQQGGDR